MDRLLVVQISDLHMSHRLDATVLDRPAGLRGHDPLLCRLLVTRIPWIARRHRVNPSEIRWIISGDLTRVGDGPEFDVARGLMEEVPPRDQFGRPLRPALGVDRDEYADVPGNHDHFDGWDELSQWGAFRNPPPAWSGNLFPDRFRSTPWDNLADPWRSHHGSIQLELFGVDSNSGLAGTAANRFARGDISDAEFALLEDSLAQNAELPGHRATDRVRAIVCHHAFTRGSLLDLALPLSRRSTRRLLRLAARHRVAAVLTGHTHLFRFQRLRVRATPAGETQERDCTVYEIRSPTTLLGPAAAAINGFIVHDIHRKSKTSDVTWNVALYLLAAGQMHPQTVESLLLP